MTGIASCDERRTSWSTTGGRLALDLVEFVLELCQLRFLLGGAGLRLAVELVVVLVLLWCQP